MDHLFSITRRPSQQAFFQVIQNSLQEQNVISAVSRRNVIAFTSYLDLSEINPKTYLVTVYVADLNVPYEVHRVTSHYEDITCLEWDHSGTRLLIGDAMGGVQVYSQKDNLLREWTEVSSHVAFAGERVMTGSWLHDGSRISLSPEKKDAPVLERFTRDKSFKSSSKQFGGKVGDGFVVISSSGLVWSLVFLPDGTTVYGIEMLGSFRRHLRAVDLSYRKNGDFLVATSTGSVDSSINCFTVNITPAGMQDKAKCVISCEPFTSFYLNATESNAPIETHSAITHLKFIVKEDPDAIIVGTTGTAGSTVELWELREEPIVLHSVFQKEIKKEPSESEMEVDPPPTSSPSEESTPSTTTPIVSKPPTKTFQVWKHHASDTYSSAVVSLTSPRISIFDSSPPPSFIGVGYKDNFVRILFRKGLKEVGKISPANSSNRKTTQDGSKSSSVKPNLSASSRVCDLQYSSNAGVLIALTSTSEMHGFRLSALYDLNSPFSWLPPQTFLSYCLLSGTDWWDILVGIKPSAIESIFEQILSSFQSLPSSIQVKLSSRLQMLKGCLYRCLPARSSSSVGQVKSGDAFATLMLQAVSAFLKSLLRVGDNQEREGPAENLTTLISTRGKGFLNVNTVLLELETRDFFVEPGFLPSLQYLNQWIADLTLYLLSSLPYQIHKNYRFPGGSLIHDLKSINSLRELLVIIRIWGLINELCLPIFTRLNSDVDVIAHIFKLLTIRGNTIGTEPDEALLNECYQLPNQVLVNQPMLTWRGRGIASPILYSSPLPLNLQYLSRIPHHETRIKTHVIEGAVAYNLNRGVDAIRHMPLGTLVNDDSKLRHCTRCKSVSLLPSSLPPRSPSIRAWDFRFATRCPCSGYWS